MEGQLIVVIAALVALIVGVGVGFILRKGVLGREIKSSEERAKSILEQAEKNAKSIQKEAELSAKDMAFKAKVAADEDEKKRRQDLSVIEKRLLSKEDNLDRKLEQIERREADLKKSRREFGK
jgi:ribonuclease Y